MFLRLHRTTWLILLLTLIIGVLANVGGDEADGAMHFGWPWIYGHSETIYNFRAEEGIWRLDRISEWHGTSLVANAAIGILLVAAASALWEWRCRRKRSWLQFSLSDGFVYLAVACTTIAAWRYVYQDDFAMARLNRSLAGTKIRVHTQHDFPADWFWITFRVPVEHRPRRLILANFQAMRGADFPADIGSRLDGFGSITRLVIHDIRPADSGHIPQLNDLTSLLLTGDSSDQLRIFSRTTHLRSLDLSGNDIDDAGLANLAQNRSLAKLYLSGSPKLQLANLTAWPELESIVLQRVGLSRAGCEAISKLKNLHNLKIEDCHRLTPADWAILVRAPALEIVEFSGTFDDQGASALAQSNSIMKIFVEKTQLTDAGIELLTKIPTLQVLRIGANNSCLTDRSLEHLIEFQQRPRAPNTFVASEIHLETARPDVVRAARKLQIAVGLKREQSSDVEPLR